jgi:hypothetical protein
MKVIFLDIDGVLNCKTTPNPRKFHTSSTRNSWPAFISCLTERKLKSFSPQPGEWTQLGCMLLSIGAFRLSVYVPTCPSHRGAKKCSPGFRIIHE